MRMAIAAAILVSLASPVAAEWMHVKGEDNPFKGGAELIAMAVEITGFSAGFRCATQNDLTMVFIAPERPDPAALKRLQNIPTTIAVIIDDRPQIVLPANIETTPDARRYRASATYDEVGTVLHYAAAARRRVAVAVKLGAAVMEKILWTQSFNASGSRRALQPLIDGCKIPPPS